MSSYLKTYTINGETVTVEQFQDWYNDEWEPTYFLIKGPSYRVRANGAAPDSDIELKAIIAQQHKCDWTPADERALKYLRMERQFNIAQSDVDRAAHIVKQREEELPRAVEIAQARLKQAQETLAIMISQRDTLKAQLEALYKAQMEALYKAQLETL